MIGINNMAKHRIRRSRHLRLPKLLKPSFTEEFATASDEQIEFHREFYQEYDDWIKAHPDWIKDHARELREHNAGCRALGLVPQTPDPVCGWVLTKRQKKELSAGPSRRVEHADFSPEDDAYFERYYAQKADNWLAEHLEWTKQFPIASRKHHQLMKRLGLPSVLDKSETEG